MSEVFQVTINEQGASRVYSAVKVNSYTPGFVVFNASSTWPVTRARVIEFNLPAWCYGLDAWWYHQNNVTVVGRKSDSPLIKLYE